MQGEHAPDGQTFKCSLYDCEPGTCLLVRHFNYQIKGLRNPKIAQPDSAPDINTFEASLAQRTVDIAQKGKCPRAATIAAEISSILAKQHKKDSRTPKSKRDS